MHGFEVVSHFLLVTQHCIDHLFTVTNQAKLGSLEELVKIYCFIFDTIVIPIDLVLSTELHWYQIQPASGQYPTSFTCFIVTGYYTFFIHSSKQV